MTKRDAVTGQWSEGDGYKPEISDCICAELADGKSLRTICQKEGMPSRSTIFNWLRTHADFAEAYRIATEERAESYAEEIVDIADDGSKDYVSDGEGGMRVDHEHIQRSRLRVDARKWICAKMKPKKYGDKLAVGGAGDLPPVLVSRIELVDLKNENSP